uniref:Uncharacterized protein n=1 Tax=Globodera pallida TaxID=36090 RepID=A0A183BUA7_GLOPA
MNAKQMLFLLVLHLLSIIALSGTTKYVDFDEMYSNLFHLPLNGAINESEKGYQIWEFDQNLKFRLEGALFHNEQQQQSLVSNCELWKFWRNLGETFDKFNLLDAETQNLVQNRDLLNHMIIK